MSFTFHPAWEVESKKKLHFKGQRKQTRVGGCHGGRHSEVRGLRGGNCTGENFREKIS